MSCLSSSTFSCASVAEANIPAAAPPQGQSCSMASRETGERISGVMLNALWCRFKLVRALVSVWKMPPVKSCTVKNYTDTLHWNRVVQMCRLKVCSWRFEITFCWRRICPLLLIAGGKNWNWNWNQGIWPGTLFLRHNFKTTVLLFLKHNIYSNSSTLAVLDRKGNVQKGNNTFITVTSQRYMLYSAH